MTLMRRWVAAALLGLALFTSGVYQARAAEADPAVWGVYAQLVGTSWKGEFGTRATRWGEGNQMIEDDSSFGQSVITPGPTPGTLTLELGSTGLHRFQGTIATDGSVLWIRDGMLKMPYRVLLRDNQLVEEAVKLSGSEVASVKRAMRYQQVDGPRNASQSTPMPIPGPTSPAAVANVSTAGGEAAAAVVAVPSTPTSVFGPLGALDGQQFAGDTLPLKVHVTNGGRTLTLEEGTSTYVLNATDVPGIYGVAAHPNMLHEYHHEDSFVGQLNADGAIEIRYRTRGVSGSKYASDLYRFNGNGIVIERFAENWKGRRMVGSPRVYVPATPELLQAALANAISVTRAREEGEIENRRAEAERSVERAAMFNSAMQGVAGGLSEVTAGGYNEAQANLDATVANINAAAAMERQQQALAAQQEQARAAEANRQQLAENARWVAEKEQAAAEYRSGQADAAAARAAQLQEQQQASEQRRAAAELQRRNAEQTATIERQRLQAAALADRPQVTARPTAGAAPARQSVAFATDTPAPSLSSGGGGDRRLHFFFVNVEGVSREYVGPVRLTSAEATAEWARVRSVAATKYGSGAKVTKHATYGDVRCGFVYQDPGRSTFTFGSQKTMALAEENVFRLRRDMKAPILESPTCD